MDRSGLVSPAKQQHVLPLHTHTHTHTHTQSQNQQIAPTDTQACASGEKGYPGPKLVRPQAQSITCFLQAIRESAENAVLRQLVHSAPDTGTTLVGHPPLLSHTHCLVGISPRQREQVRNTYTCTVCLHANVRETRACATHTTGCHPGRRVTEDASWLALVRVIRQRLLCATACAQNGVRFRDILVSCHVYDGCALRDLVPCTRGCTNGSLLVPAAHPKPSLPPHPIPTPPSVPYVFDKRCSPRLLEE